MKTDIENIRKLREEHEAQFEKTVIGKPALPMRPFVAARWGYVAALLAFYRRGSLTGKQRISGEGEWGG